MADCSSILVPSSSKSAQYMKGFIAWYSSRYWARLRSAVAISKHVYSPAWRATCHYGKFMRTSASFLAQRAYFVSGWATGECRTSRTVVWNHSNSACESAGMGSGPAGRWAMSRGGQKGDLGGRGTKWATHVAKTQSGQVPQLKLNSLEEQVDAMDASRPKVGELDQTLKNLLTLSFYQPKTERKGDSNSKISFLWQSSVYNGNCLSIGGITRCTRFFWTHEGSDSSGSCW